MVFQCINIRQVPWEVLKTAAFGLGFQHLPRDLANVNAWKTMFDPYNKSAEHSHEMSRHFLWNNNNKNNLKKHLKMSSAAVVIDALKVNNNHNIYKFWNYRIYPK